MKLAIVCLTKEFDRPGNSGSYRDYLYIKKELELIAEEVVTITTELLDTKEVSGLNGHFDGIIMLNASVNFFGGVLNEKIVTKWKFVTSQTCPVIYWFTDFLLPLQQVDKKINNKFHRDLIPLDPKRVTVVSFAKEIKMVKEWWYNSKRNVPVEKFVYYPLSESCYKHLEHLEPLRSPINETVYIGNYRNGNRLEQIQKLSIERNLAIYGRWPDKYVPFQVNYKGPVSEEKVDEIINTYYSQFITYDYEYLKFKPDIFRHIITINSGCLPLIDPKLETLYPTVVQMGYDIEYQGRYIKIKILQEALKTHFPNKFYQLIKEICS